MSHSIKPEEHELREARQVVEGALAACESTWEKEEDFEICLGAKSKDNYEERGAFGQAWNEGLIRIMFNPSHGDDWKSDLRQITIYSYGESLFYEKMGAEFDWQKILAKAFALKFMERCGEDEEEIDRKKAEENWRERENEKFEPSWDLAYLIGQKLLEKHALEDFPDLKRSDVLDAGDELFD